MLAPVTAHVHIVDAGGVDDEGLQIGEGEIDFAILSEQLERLAPGRPSSLRSGKATKTVVKDSGPPSTGSNVPVTPPI